MRPSNKPCRGQSGPTVKKTREADNQSVMPVTDRHSTVQSMMRRYFFMATSKGTGSMRITKGPVPRPQATFRRLSRIGQSRGSPVRRPALLHAPLMVRYLLTR